MHPTSWVIPQEKTLKTKKDKKNLSIGVPKENSSHENRIALTPEAVAVLVANGHAVYVQKGAGVASSYSDREYSEAGAFICYSLEDIYVKSDFIVKISPLSGEELDLLRPNQGLFSAVNLGSLTPDYLKVLIKKNITAIGFEFLQSRDRSLPIVQMMSEIAGVSSVHIAAELLCGTNGGKGILLGGITGVPPAVVTIIGAGTVGYNAAQTALSMGALVKVIDEEIHKLRRLEKELGVNIYTAVSLQKYIEEAVLSSDVVIGAAFKKGYRAPVIVSEDIISQMKEGSVVVDVAIDQGGCIATSRVTTHERPTFVKHGVIHYCVPNIASRVAATASAAISNILGPLLVKIGDFGGIAPFMKQDEGFKQSIYVYRKHLTKQSLSSLFGMDYVDIRLLIASDL
ncbi:MAG: alanine dehydrogenase [Bacteroidia bacterium]|nr:alanine dehydrogenase [Bacteroidia bacterium]